jgi:hypothetical protein
MSDFSSIYLYLWLPFILAWPHRPLADERNNHNHSLAERNRCFAMQLISRSNRTHAGSTMVPPLMYFVDTTSHHQAPPVSNLLPFDVVIPIPPSFVLPCTTRHQCSLWVECVPVY